MIRIDTNYIIRYLINDDVKIANIAEELLTKKNVFISNEVLAEVVYVLLGVYKISREDIANQLIEFISFENIMTLNDSTIIDSLNIFKNQNLDFVDSLLCAYSKEDEIVTFDKKLKKCFNNKVKTHATN